MVNSIENKYKKLYIRIIENRTNNPVTENIYTENHHIIPKSLNGNNDKINLVKLTAREHYICHYLLTKMYLEDTIEYYKMIYAFTMMQCNGRKQKRYTSKLYEYCRIKYSRMKSIEQSGNNNSQYNTQWISNEELRISKKISRDDIIPENWVKGNKPWIKKERILQKKKLSKEKLNKIINEYEIYYNKLFQQFKESTCKSVTEFVRKGFYDKSIVSLTLNWKKYVPEYKLSSKERISFKSTLL